MTAKVLIVDDDMRNLYSLSKILTERGFQVIKAGDGKVALEIIDKINPQIFSYYKSNNRRYWPILLLKLFLIVKLKLFSYEKVIVNFYSVGNCIIPS